MKTIIIADDHQIFRESLSELLSNHGFKVIGLAANGIELLELLKNEQPDIVITDIDMPKMEGCEASEKAIKLYPTLNILTLSSFGEERYYYRMVQAGVKGFVLKNSGMHDLLAAINEILDGGSWFSNELLQNAIKSFNKQSTQTTRISLTERESEVLKYICNGLTAKDIAMEMSVSHETVRTHRANLLSKTGCRNTPALIIYAIKNNLITIDN